VHAVDVELDLLVFFEVHTFDLGILEHFVIVHDVQWWAESQTLADGVLQVREVAELFGCRVEKLGVRRVFDLAIGFDLFSHFNHRLPVLDQVAQYDGRIVSRRVSRRKHCSNNLIRNLRHIILINFKVIQDVYYTIPIVFILVFALDPFPDSAVDEVEEGGPVIDGAFEDVVHRPLSKDSPVRNGSHTYLNGNVQSIKRWYMLHRGGPIILQDMHWKLLAGSIFAK